jgi:hypothetical protein
MAAGAVAAGGLLRHDSARDICAALTAAATFAALAVSVARRKAGVAGEREREQRVAARLPARPGGVEAAHDRSERHQNGERAEFPPILDAIAPVIGAAGLVFAGATAGGPQVLAVARTLVGAAFLGAVSDAMLLGHWYLVQPGLPRGPVKELVAWTARAWPFEIAVFLWPTGMVQVINGVVADGYHGVLGWIWIGCAVLTIGLVGLTWAALRERYYSAVMAATGLLYLAILTAFGTDLVARAVLRP